MKVSDVSVNQVKEVTRRLAIGCSLWRLRLLFGYRYQDRYLARPYHSSRAPALIFILQIFLSNKLPSYIAIIL